MIPRAVILDCDGVIVDTEPVTLDLLVADFAARGHPFTPAQLEPLFLGGTMTGVFAQARALGVPLPDGWVDDFYARLYVRLAAGTALIPGLLTLLDRLDAAGIACAVASNGLQAKMAVTLGQHPGLMARFGGRVFSAQTLAAPKPAPDVYLHAAAALGQTPASCVAVEDSPTGARAAAAAGIRCFGYAPHGNGAALAAAGAIPFAAMSDLPRLIGL